MKYFCLVFILLFTLPGFAQDFYILTLDQTTIPSQVQDFKIIEVIDGRKTKHNIGVVYTGINHKSKVADFKNILKQEIFDFIARSIVMASEPSIAIRVTHLKISEQAKSLSETSKAEVTMEFFLKEKENYFFITKTYSSTEAKGIEVTYQHSSNIGQTIVNCIKQFEKRNWQSMIDRSIPYNISQLKDGVEVLPDFSAIKVYNTEKYNDGVYLTFDEFLQNAPSIINNYKIKFGKRTKLWVKKDGIKSRITEGVYVFAQHNKFYVLFHKNFYLLKERRDGFYFTGPHIPDHSAVFNATIMNGLVGGYIASKTTGGKTVYKIDMNSGMILLVR